VVLVEGLWLLRKAQLRRLFALSVFIECGEKARLRRRLERDQAERGREAAAIRKQFHEQVAPMHQRHVAPQARWATVVVRSPISAREVEQLVAQIRSCCLGPDRSIRGGRRRALVGGEV
jgi:uridine kinase